MGKYEEYLKGMRKNERRLSQGSQENGELREDKWPQIEQNKDLEMQVRFSS